MYLLTSTGSEQDVHYRKHTRPDYKARVSSRMRQTLFRGWCAHVLWRERLDVRGWNEKIKPTFPLPPQHSLHGGVDHEACIVQQLSRRRFFLDAPIVVHEHQIVRVNRREMGTLMRLIYIL